MIIRALGLLLLFLPGLTLAADEGVRFVGAVQEDDRAVVEFDIVVPAGTETLLSVKGDYRLEFRAAAVSGKPKDSAIRLLNASGRQLHESIIPGTATRKVSAEYLICEGSVIFISPAPSERTPCEE